MKGDSGFMFTKDDSLKAVFSTELDSFLGRLGLLDSFREGNVVCRYCKRIITKENLYALVPDNGTVNFCCNSPRCVLFLAEEARK